MIRDVAKLKRIIEAGGIDFTETDNETPLGNGCIKELIDMIEQKDKQIERLQESIHLEVHASKKLKGICHYLIDVMEE